MPAAATLSLQLSTGKHGPVLHASRQEPPWRVIRAFPNAGGEAVMHLHNVSGGVLAGDYLRLEVEAEPGTRAQITTVGATRVYRHRCGAGSACHSTSFKVGGGAFVEYLPDPLIPFAGARFSQDCDILLSPDAGLIWWETLAPGRAAYGESFQYERLSVNTIIRSACGPLVVERYAVEPEQVNMASPARMGSYLYSSTMYVCRTDGSHRWRGLEDELNTMAQALSNEEALWGASSLACDGVVVRGMARRSKDIQQGLRCMWSAAKLAVWGRAATLPRKVY